MAILCLEDGYLIRPNGIVQAAQSWMRRSDAAVTFGHPQHDLQVRHGATPMNSIHLILTGRGLWTALIDRFPLGADKRGREGPFAGLRVAASEACSVQGEAQLCSTQGGGERAQASGAHDRLLYMVMDLIGVEAVHVLRMSRSVEADSLQRRHVRRRRRCLWVKALMPTRATRTEVHVCIQQLLRHDIKHAWCETLHSETTECAGGRADRRRSGGCSSGNGVHTKRRRGVSGESLRSSG